MHAINSVSNNKIKEIVKLHQKKYREQTGLFLVEGLKPIKELIDAGIEITEIFSTKETSIPALIIDESTMKKIATTSSPCEILAVAKQRKTDINLFKKLNKLILLESINDPGNLGTIIRSAAAFGVEGIILFGDCVDLYSSKVIRSAAGNFFKTNIIEIKDVNLLKEFFPNHKLISTSLSKENNIDIKDCSKFNQYIIMFGSEAKGLCKELTDITDNNIKLYMTNNVESLNLSVSASVIMYELL